MGNVKGKGSLPSGKPEERPPDKAPEKPERATVVPTFFDPSGVLLKLRNRDFPKTKAGRMAFCDYNIERWKVRKVRVETQADPKQRKLKKIEKLKDMLAKLEAEVAEEAKATA